MKTKPIRMNLENNTGNAAREKELEQLKACLNEAALACHGKGAGKERQDFEQLQGEYAELTGDLITEQEARRLLD